jgi:hypothetical protein
MKTILLLLMALPVQFVIAQDFDFGKVSKEELMEKKHPLDSSAAAAYLYKDRKTYFRYDQSQGFEMYTDVHERIKIYSKAGFDYATKKIVLYKNGREKESVSGIKAMTYNITGDNIEEEKLKNDGVFTLELSRYFNQTSFTMPNIKEGSVIEYKYTVLSPFISNVDEFEFQHDIPIKKLVAKFESPEYFNFRMNLKGFLDVRPKMEKKNGSITFNSKERSGGNGWSPTQTSFSTSKIDYVTNVSDYELRDIPALKMEPHVNNINNYRSAVNYELSYTKFPNTPLKYYAISWEDVVKTIYESPDFGSELTKEGYYNKDIDILIKDISDPYKKVGAIFNFVKQRVKWNGNYGKYVHDGVRKAYQEGVGNVAEINLMLTSMLRYAGLDANPVLVSTRDNGVPLFPTREGYNYVISGVETPDGVILLDATSVFSMPNILPLRVLNWNGRLIRKDGNSTEINLFPKDKAGKAIAMQVDITNESDIEGKIRNVYRNHGALLYRDAYNTGSKEDHILKLETKYGGLEIGDFEVKGELDLVQPLTESYTFRKEDQIEIIGSQLYLYPLFFLTTTENPFKLEKREFPVDFGYAEDSKYMVTINIPEGYKVESIPEPIALMLPDNLGLFKYNIAVTPASVQLVVDSSINEAVIPYLYYDSLKDYYRRMIEKMGEKIVLVKI